MKVDLHIHSIYSDGSDDEISLAKKIKASGIEVCSLTDHDEIEGCDKLKPLLDGVYFLRGVEFSCVNELAKYHILGYGYDPKNETLISAVEKGKILRKRKLETRLDYLRKIHHIVFSDEEIAYLRSIKSVGRPHLAEVMVRMGIAKDIQDAIARYLKNLPSERERISVSTAINAIHSAGGIAVWAHPLGGEGSVHLQEEEFERRLQPLLACGIQGLECYYSRYTKEEISFLSGKAEKYRLFVSGGSDYHGTNKNIELATLNSDGFSVDHAELSLLHEFNL